MRMNKVFITTLLFTSLVSAQIQSGKVLYLDGQSDFVQLFEPIIQDVPFTVEAWFYAFEPGGGVYAQNPIFEQRSLQTVINASAILLNGNNGEGLTAWTIRDQEHFLNRASTPQPHYHEWHHVAGVVDHDMIHLYLDGELVDSTPNQQSGPFHLDYDHVTIGRHAYHDIVAGYLNGYVDELRIWKTARSQRDINAFMHEPLNPRDIETRAHLLAYWNFDAEYEWRKDGIYWRGIKDLSGNEFHGALMGDAELAPLVKERVPLHDFSLLQPIDGQIVQTTCPVFAWESATDADIQSPESITYELLLDTSANFANPLPKVTRGKKTVTQMCDLQPDIVYYWKVRAQNWLGEVIWSTQTYSFTISNDDTQLVTLKDFSLITPGFDATIRTTRPTVFWEPATDNELLNADDIIYEIFYSTEPDFQHARSVMSDGSNAWTELPKLQAGHTYFWKVLAKNRADEQKWSLNYSAMFISHDATDIDQTGLTPGTIILSQNYPNPFNLQTTISFALPDKGYVELHVYDYLGKKVNTLASRHYSAGISSVVWDGRDFQGYIMASGIYIYQLIFQRLEAKETVWNKMILLK